MRACWCVLAGTKACDNCPNGPSNSNVIMKMPVFPGEMKKKKYYTWISTTSSKK